MAKYGIPYQGSKQAIADELIKQFPKAEHFYDLFGGGGSITHAMVVNRRQDYKTFHYNEIDPLIVKFFQAAIAGEFSYDRFKPKWVSRERFFEKKDNSGYVKAIWSFGSGGKGYLYGKEIEEYKKSMHMAIIFDEFDTMATNILGFNRWPADITKIFSRRMYLRNKITYFRKRGIMPDIVRPILSEKQQATWSIISGSHQLQTMQHLERLELIQQLQKIQDINITNLSYAQVPILGPAIVYCDIPYLDTTGYGAKFNREAFLDWADKLTVPVYISEYNISDPRFEQIWQGLRRKGMQQGLNDQKVIEKLYVNRAGQNG